MSHESACSENPIKQKSSKNESWFFLDFTWSRNDIKTRDPWTIADWSRSRTGKLRHGLGPAVRGSLIKTRFSSFNKNRKSNLSCWWWWITKNRSMGIKIRVRIFNFSYKVPNEWMEKLSIFIYNWCGIKNDKKNPNRTVRSDWEIKLWVWFGHLV